MDVFIIPIVIIASSCWVLFDAKAHKLGSVESNTPSPFKMTLGCLFVWIVCLPYYLFKRNSFIEKAQKSPNVEAVTNGQKIILTLAAIFILGLTYKDYIGGDVSTCDSTEVIQLVKDITKDNYGDGYTFSDFGQASYDVSTESRYCRVAWELDGQQGIIDFTVNWFNDKKENIYVNFQ